MMVFTWRAQLIEAPGTRRDVHTVMWMRLSDAGELHVDTTECQEVTRKEGSLPICCYVSIN